LLEQQHLQRENGNIMKRIQSVRMSETVKEVRTVRNEKEVGEEQRERHRAPPLTPPWGRRCAPHSLRLPSGALQWPVAANVRRGAK